MAANDFSAGVLKEAGQITINDKHLKSLKVIEGVTIDDVNSKDLDDGFQLETESDGWILYVSIADAASYIEKDSNIFESAKNSVYTRYIPGRKIPMLPPELSENKLSLLEKKLRPALTYKITISSDADVVGFEVLKTAFKNRRQLSYQITDEILARERPDKEFGHLAECYHLANLLLEKRRDRGALVIYDFIKGMYTNEEGQIIIPRNQKLHMANIIVQEFMILVNSAAAEFFIQRNKQLILRNHTAKSTTPPRDEIYSQYILAKSNADTVETLKKRIELWFEKAEYSTKLRGHYGLNLPAYTHITSPLRRFPDLANQYIIHSYVSGKRTPFTKDNLSKLALRINRNMRDIKDSKAKFFKEKAVNELLEIADSKPPDALEFVDNRKFKILLCQSCYNNNISKKLAQEIEKRILNGNVGAEHLICILFELHKNNEYYEKFLKLSFDFLKKNPGTGSSLLNIIMQKKYIPEIRRQSRHLQGGFVEIITTTLKGVSFSSPETKILNSKKEAFNFEALNFLENYFSNKLVPVKEIKFSNASKHRKSDNFAKLNKGKAKFVESEQIPQINYAGKLYEFCMKNKIFSHPEFSFTQTGPSNNSVFYCTCIVRCGDVIFETNSSSRKKNFSKHEASKEMTDKLMQYLKSTEFAENKQEEPVFVKEKSAKHLNGENYVGVLENLSSFYKNIFRADFEFSEQNQQDGKFIHKCDCIVSIQGKIFTASAERDSKKDAKQSASGKIIETLTENSLIAKNQNGQYEITVLKKIDEPKINYSGILSKIVLYYENFSEPEYEFSVTGKSNKPDIAYRCKLKTEKDVFVTEFVSTKKTVSKQKAAHLMIHKLLGLYAEELTDFGKPGNNEISAGQGIVDVIRDKNIDLQYKLYKWNDSKKPLFSCMAELVYNSTKFTFLTAELKTEKAVSETDKLVSEFLGKID
jgi:ribonuclease R